MDAMTTLPAVPAALTNTLFNYAGHTIMTHIHDYGTVRYDMGYACALSTLLLLIMLIMNKVIPTWTAR